MNICLTTCYSCLSHMRGISVLFAGVIQILNFSSYFHVCFKVVVYFSRSNKNHYSRSDFDHIGYDLLCLRVHFRMLGLCGILDITLGCPIL